MLVLTRPVSDHVEWGLHTCCGFTFIVIGLADSVALFTAFSFLATMPVLCWW